MSVRAPVGPVNIATQQICIGRGLAAIRPTENSLDKMYAFWILHSLEGKFSGKMGTAFASVNMKEIESFLIPLPSLSVQKAFVAEIEAERSLIASNRELKERMERKIEKAVERVWSCVTTSES